MYNCRNQLKPHKMNRPELTKREVYLLIEKHLFYTYDKDLGDVDLQFEDARHLLGYLNIAFHKNECDYELVNSIIKHIQFQLTHKDHFLEDCRYQKIPIKLFYEVEI